MILLYGKGTFKLFSNINLLIINYVKSIFCFFKDEIQEDLLELYSFCSMLINKLFQNLDNIDQFGKFRKKIIKIFQSFYKIDNENILLTSFFEIFDIIFNVFQQEEQK